MITLYFFIVPTCVLLNLGTAMAEGVFTAVKKYNETCVHSDDCYDDRMVCTEDENNIARCLCNRFHSWNETSGGCVQIYSVAYIINQTVTVHEYREELHKIQDLMFRGPIYSIFFMIFVVALCCVSIIGYCIYTSRKDRQLYLLVKELKEQKLKEEWTRRSAFRTEQVTHL